MNLLPSAALIEALVGFGARVRGLVGTDGPFPWRELERLVDDAIGAVEKSPELPWSVHAPSGADPVALHQWFPSVSRAPFGRPVVPDV